MIKQPNWKVQKEISGNSKTNSRRKIYLESEDSFLSKAILEIDENSIILMIPTHPIMTISNKNNIISFKENWRTILIIETTQNFTNMPHQDILHFFKKVCKKPVYPPINIFNQNYKIHDIKILLYFFIQKLISENIIPVYPEIEKNKEKICLDLNFNFPYFEKTGYVSEINLYGMKKSDKEEKFLKDSVEEFLLSLQPEQKYGWKTTSKYLKVEDNVSLTFEQISWDSGELKESLISPLTAHEKMKFKKIVENFLKTSKILNGGPHD